MAAEIRFEQDDRSANDSLLPDNPIRPPFRRAFHTYTITPPEAPFQLGLTIHVPAYGFMFMNPPEEAKLEAALSGDPPRYENALNCQFEVTLPPGISRMRYKQVKMGFRTVFVAREGGIDTDEVDVLFRKEMTHGAQNADGEDNIIEGSEKFLGSFMIPSTLPYPEWHKDGRITCTAYAIIEGLPIPNATSQKNVGLIAPFSDHADGDESEQNSSGSSKTVTTGAKAWLSNVLARKALASQNKPASKTITKVERKTMPTVTDPEGEAVWLMGRHVAERAIRLVYNPEPDGGFSTLNEFMRGNVDGLGMYNIRLFSDIWTVSTIMKVTLAITDPPPETTVFNFKISLHQTHTVTSPRTGKSRVSTYRYTFLEKGKQPDKVDLYPGPDVPALWRGEKAGGKDKDVLLVEETARLPDDTVMRPSTPAGVETPISVSQALETDLYFSVYGQNAKGQPLRVRGPGELRVMRVRRNIVLPPCSLMPDAVQLPDYHEPPTLSLGQHTTDPLKPWDVCACYLSDEEVEHRLKHASVMEEVAQKERDEAARRKAQSTDQVRVTA